MWEEKKNFFLIVLGIITMNLLIVGVGIWLFFYQIQGRASVLQNLQEKLNLFELQQLSVGRMEKLIERSSRGLNEVQRTFFTVNKENIIHFIEIVERLAEQESVAVDFIAVPDSHNTTTADFRFSLQGSFTEVMNMIALLEQMPMLIRVGDAELKRLGSGNTVFADITVSIETL